MARYVYVATLLTCLPSIATISSPAHARTIQETGVAAEFDDQGKTKSELCAAARRDAERKVPRNAKNVKYTAPVFTGRTLHGRPGHNCIVYVSFDPPAASNDDNPFARPYQLPSTQPGPSAPNVTPRTAHSAAISELSSQCKSQLKALIVGSEAKDRDKVHAAYAALRTQCDEGIRKLAQAANARLPERRLSSRASSALAAAMNRQPSQSTFNSGDRSGSPNGGSRPASNSAPAYDIDEVIELGIGILGLLNGVASLQPSRAATTVRQPTNTSGRNAPPPTPAPPNKPSKITGN
jgi:hypothetical protein